MASRTAVDIAALAGAATTASRLSGDLLATAGASGQALARLASELAGARSGPEVTALRQANEGLLVDLGRALEQLSRALRAAAAGYGEAETHAITVSAPGAGAK